MAPLTPTESVQQKRIEAELGQLGMQLEAKRREAIIFLESLKKKYDPEFEKNSKQQISKYSAIVHDNFLVLTID